MAMDYENKIYIPEDFENTLFERLPLSNGLLSFLKRNKIHFLKDLQRVKSDVVKQIVSSSEKPFPELRRFITQIQKSPSGQVILEQEIDTETVIPEKSYKIEQINEVINIPKNLKQLPISYLIPSNHLASRLKKINISSLNDLHGQQYEKFLETAGFGKKLVSELQSLITFVTSLQSISDFESILFASIKRKRAEEKTDNTPEQEKQRVFAKPSNKSIREQDSGKIKIEKNRIKKNVKKLTSIPLKQKISVPIAVRELQVNRFPFSVRLVNILKNKNITLLGDLEKFSYSQLKKTPNCGSKSITELQEFIAQIQENGAGISDKTSDLINSLPPQLNLNELLDFINKFIEQMPSAEKEILLDRFGGSPDEKVLKFEEIAKKHQITKELASQRYIKIIEKLKNRIEHSADNLFEKLKTDCLEAVCPLTPQFLVYLTNNDYNLFTYPPAFYIRLIGKLSSEVPTLPEFENKSGILKADATKVVKKIELFLRDFSLPASLSEVLHRVVSTSSVENDSGKIFFEAIQSAKFNLIKTNDPKELFIELSDVR